MKLCRDCKFYSAKPARGDSECSHPNNCVERPDYVNGGVTVDVQYFGAHFIRQQRNLCGPEAVWFEGRRTDD